jgi:prepilin-type N-terminal cleavage/methylation domain-containing protein
MFLQRSDASSQRAMPPARLCRGPRPRAAGGYSLIEVVMALSVICVALLGVFHLLAGVLGTNAESGNRSFATHLAASRLEVARGQEVASLVTSEGNSDPELTAALGPSATWDLLVTDIGPGMKGILVTVHWKQGELAQSVSLGTLAQAGGIASIRNRYAN